MSFYKEDVEIGKSTERKIIEFFKDYRNAQDLIYYIHRCTGVEVEKVYSRIFNIFFRLNPDTSFYREKTKHRLKCAIEQGYLIDVLKIISKEYNEYFFDVVDKKILNHNDFFDKSVSKHKSNRTHKPKMNLDEFNNIMEGMSVEMSEYMEDEMRKIWNMMMTKMREKFHNFLNMKSAMNQKTVVQEAVAPREQVVDDPSVEPEIHMFYDIKELDGRINHNYPKHRNVPELPKIQLYLKNGYNVDMTVEEWKLCHADGELEVSNWGNVRSTKDKRILPLWKGKNRRTKKTCVTISKAVFDAFISNGTLGPYRKIGHFDHNIKNNRLDNLYIINKAYEKSAVRENKNDFFINN